LLPTSPTFPDSVILESVRPVPASVAAIPCHAPAAGKIGRGKLYLSAQYQVGLHTQSFCLSIDISIYLSIHIYTYHILSLYLSIFLSIYLAVDLLSDHFLYKSLSAYVVTFVYRLSFSASFTLPILLSMHVGN
jgi:hypothetical protein